MSLGFLIPIAHVLGILSALHALFHSPTSQGAVGWIVSLVTFPYLVVPAYWIFGRSRFHGYVMARQTVDVELHRALGRLWDGVAPFAVDPLEGKGRMIAVARLARMPFTRGNEVDLLGKGEDAFESMLSGIARAKRYVLVQFYIIHDDLIGRDFRDTLVRKASEGVPVYLLYDDIGCSFLPKPYLRSLKRSGVRVAPFRPNRGPRNRFQINFRNHRKIVVVDGTEGWTGGFNVGDEYLGRSLRFGPWRDTHIRLRGPAVLGLQIPFMEDWYWATRGHLDLSWEAVESGEGDERVLILPSGPADQQATASLMMQHIIHGAARRFWIASPYFVPDGGVQNALELAVLRGVDVRVLIPDRPDHLLVYLSAFSFLEPMIRAGIKVYRYLPGFLHEKVFLADDGTSAVGTVNIDNRSFRLNFEITALVLGVRTAADVERMFLDDFEKSRLMTADEIRERPFWFRLASRAAYLTSPIL